MKMLKFFAWFFIIYGILEILGIFFIDTESHRKELVIKYGPDIIKDFMPLWKHWFIAVTGIIGGMSLIYFIKKLKLEMKNDSYWVRFMKEGNLFSIFFTCMGIQMLVVEWNSPLGEQIKIISSVVILIGIVWNFLCRYSLNKDESRK